MQIDFTKREVGGGNLNWLKEKREAKNMTMRSVASSARVSESYYNLIENGIRRPSVAVAKRIAAVLGFEWVRFFE